VTDQLRGTIRRMTGFGTGRVHFGGHESRLCHAEHL
jgi:hypothetical protein